VLEVIIERGEKRVFASAVDWPGYARSGKTEAEALGTLAAYAQRYAKVVKGIAAFTAPRDASAFTVVQRVGGGAGTDFGAPSSQARTDGDTLSATDVATFMKVIEACWSAFDRAARAASGKTLRTGPRGGGRSVEKMTAHVLEADVMYLAKLGSRVPKTADADRARAVRRTILAALAARARGEELADPSKTATLWPPRFFARRAAWHSLDHAWELEDRSA
jgi:hypothetical protein